MTLFAMGGEVYDSDRFYYSPFQRQIQRRIKRVHLSTKKPEQRVSYHAGKPIKRTYKGSLRRKFLVYGNPVSLSILGAAAVVGFVPYAQPSPLPNHDKEILDIYLMSGLLVV